MRKKRTPAQIIAEANDFAREIYAMHGYRVEEGYRFDKARHPQERMMWRIVERAWDRFERTELSEILALEGGEDE